jgi:hypothetical protein
MKKIIYFLFLFGFISCNTGSIKPPVIHKKEMVVILYDLHLTEAYVSQLKLNTTNTLDTLSYYKQLVFEKHNTSENSFNQAMKYYAQYPEKLKNIYEVVKQQIQEKDLQLPHIDEFDNGQTFEIKDSIEIPLKEIQPFSKMKTP